jgi:hypothetical protein
VAVVLSVKVSDHVAAEVRDTAERGGESVSDLLRAYCTAIAAGRRMELVDPETDGLVGWGFLVRGRLYD